MKYGLSCIDYCKDVLGKTIDRNGRTSSLADGSQNPNSMQVKEDSFYDYKQDIGGDIVTLIAEAKYSGNIKDAFDEIRFLTGKTIEPPKDFTDRVIENHTNISKEAVKYLEDRGFTRKTINLLKIGSYENRIILPCWHNKKIHSFAARNIKDDGTSKYKNHGKTDYPFGHAYKDHDTVILCEGILDALTFIQEGYTAFASLGGAFKSLSFINRFDNVILAFDNDEPGDKFLAKTVKTLGRPFEVWSTSKENKDINKHYTENNNTLTGLRKQNGYKYIAKNITTDFLELSNFLKESGLTYDKEKAMALMSLAEQEHGFKTKGIKLDVVEKEVVDYVMKTNDLLYSHSIGFYRYSFGCWRSVTNEQIMDIISKRLGKSSTARMVESVRRALTFSVDQIGSEKDEGIKLNEKNVFSFKNGTFELDTDTFRPHRKEDYTTIQMPYEFNKEEKDERWERFLREITNNDAEKIKLLQEIAGYIFYRDCRLERAFFFLGEGSNGKSLFTDCIIETIGRYNIASVMPSDFKSPFERMRLKDKLANIVQDAEKGVNCAAFKSIVSGETVNGAYKSKDSFEFKPRCKMIINSNHLLTTNDITHGFLRRLCIIKFDQTFSLSPVAGEKLAEAKLKHVLPKKNNVIFQWMYEGYKRLQKTEKFTVLEEQKVMMEDVRREIDPFIDYLETLEDVFDINSEAKLFILKEKYDSYCNQYNIKDMMRLKTKISFSKRFSLSENWEKVRDADGVSFKRVK